MRRPRYSWHLFAGWCALVSLVLGACYWLASVELARLADQAQFRRMREVATGLASAAKTASEPVNPGAFVAAATQVERTCRFSCLLLDPQGTVLASGENPDGPRLGMEGAGDSLLIAKGFAAGGGQTAISSRYEAATGRRLVSLVVPIGPPTAPEALVQVVADTSAADGELVRSLRRVLLGYLALGGVALGAGYLLANRAARPLQELAEAALLLAGGTVDAPIPTSEPAELASLATAISTLREQLVERGLTIGRQGSQQEAVLGSMIEGVLAIDARQRIVSINRAAADLLGADAAAVVRRPLQEVVRNADLRRFALLAIDCREPVEDNLLLRGIRDRTIRVRGTALRDESGEGGAVIVLNDVTDIHHLENVRRDFVANVSHELRTPIASIKGFVETLLDGADNDPTDNRRFLEIVAKQADRLGAIIEDLLALSRIEQQEGTGNLPLEPAKVSDVLAAVESDCQPRAADRAITLVVTCDPALEAALNAPLLEQALINLVDNAIKYSEPSRTIWMSAALETPPLAPTCLLFTVRDEGCGIETEHLPRLFERFYRVDKGRSRKLGGTGLGLSIVKHIVQAHGGTVAVESQPGVGSTFQIRFPVDGSRSGG